MATRKPRRNEWRQKNGKWTRSLGERGLRVRLFQITKGGAFYRDVWLPGCGKNRRSIGTVDRAEADRIGRDLLAELLRGGNVVTEGPLTLRDLWERYRWEALQFLDNHAVSKANDANHAEVLLSFFGKECDVRGLGESDITAFAAARRAGGLILASGRMTREVGVRSVEVELRLLRMMLRWATTVRIQKGRRLLDRNPLDGIRGVREDNPRRPVASWERFTETRKAIRELVAGAETVQSHQRWLKLELALVLAEGTGRRLGSIRQLRWEDVDFTAGTIRWQAAADKKRRESVIPVPEALLAELRSFRVRLGGSFGGLMFPSEKDREVSIRRDVFDKWLRKAEAHAGLVSLEGGLWHPYRRAWATTRKHLPVTDVAQAGGWRDITTLLRCYTQADNDTILAVMSDPKKLRDKAVSA
jgi:integrase